MCQKPFWTPQDGLMGDVPRQYHLTSADCRTQVALSVLFCILVCSCKMGQINASPVFHLLYHSISSARFCFCMSFSKNESNCILHIDTVTPSVMIVNSRESTHHTTLAVSCQIIASFSLSTDGGSWDQLFLTVTESHNWCAFLILMLLSGGAERMWFGTTQSSHQDEVF